MSWSIGYDTRWKRDIGYGVPAYCDHPGCTTPIDRGLAHVCGGEPYGGDHGCGLYFCDAHHRGEHSTCQKCELELPPFNPKPDHPEWIRWKLTDPSWQEWRDANPEQVEHLSTETHPYPDSAYNVRVECGFRGHETIENTSVY